MPDLRVWLTGLGLESLAGVLAENDVDFDIIGDLTEQDLEKLGISLGHRRKLMKAIALLQSSPSEGRADTPVRAPAATPAPEAERRQVTVLFSDLVGSTALATAIDPEDMSDLIRRYQDACAGAIARFDGYIAKFMGDGVLAYFGYPQAREDAAECSVRAALAIVEAVRQVKRPDGEPLETRVGIATGLVVVGDIIGAGAAREETIVGETPNLAARLQAIAEPNNVLVSHSTHALVGRLFEYESLGDHALKGFAKPTPVWRVLREAMVASRFAAARAASLGPFVGRTQEMGLLLDRWRLAQQSEGQAVVLTAEAGMGKSRLVEALFERIREEPHRRVVAQCSPYRGNSAFFPLLRQFEQAAGFAPADSPAQKLDKLETVIAKAGVAIFPMAPLLADLLSSPTEGRYPPIDLAPAQRKDATITALADYFMGLCEREPLVFVLEDAHWIDPTTLGFLTRLIDTIASGRVLAIITARPDFVSPWVGRGHVGSLTLSRLGKSQCAEIVAGVITARLVTPDVLEEILAKTDGVPLFVEELTRAIAEADTTGRLVVPATLQDALMARLDRLGPAKEIAQLAASIGRQFSFALLAALTPVDAGDLERALAKLSEAGLVFPQARAIERSFSFKHALMRDVAYDSLLRARRQKLHERIALTLEERFPGVAEAEPEILAHHFGQAGLAARACVYCERAGERAVARFAYAEAVAHFNAGLAQADAMPSGPERSRRELALLLKLGPAIVILKGTRDPQVEQVYQRACDIAETLDDQQGLFRARWGLWFVANLNRDTRLAHDHAERLVLLGQQSEDDELFLQAIHSRWSTAFFRGDVSKALADAREGARHYDMKRHSRLGAEFGGHDPGVCAQTVSALALAQSGKARAAAASAERGIALAETLNDPSSLAFAFMNSMAAYQIIGDRDAVLRLTARMIEIADKFKLPPQRSIATFMAAWANARGDGLVSGLATMEGEFARVQIMGPLPQLYAGLLGEIRLEGGHTAQALELLDAALKVVREPGVGFYLPELQRLRGECLLRLDPPDFDGAMREFETAVATAIGQQARAFQLRARISLARAWIATGSPESGLAPLRDLVDAFSEDDDAPEIAVARHILAAHPV